MMGAVFAMQGFGQLTGAIIALIVTVGFKESLSMSKSIAACTGPCSLAVDKMWRVLIGMPINPFNRSSVLTRGGNRIRRCTGMHCSLLPSHYSRNAQIYI